MHEFLFHYEPVPATTWVYLSSFLAIALFFKFGRLWSIRNFDLIGLILLAPGLLLVREPALLGLADAEALSGAEQAVRLGYLILFVVSAGFLVRLLIDPLMVRRPLLEPNLSVGGQTFLCITMLAFLMTDVITGQVEKEDIEGALRADRLSSRQAVESDASDDEADQSSQARLYCQEIHNLIVE